MSADCAHASREWRRVRCFGGRIGESDRYVEEIWEDTCTACGTVVEERHETKAAALGSLLSGSAAQSGPYQPTRPKVTSVVQNQN